MKTKTKAKPKTRTKNKDEWQLQEAKAMYSEVVKKAEIKPQIITVHGVKKAVVMSYDEYIKLTTPKMSIVEFFRNSPLYGADIEFPPREKHYPREIEL